MTALEAKTEADSILVTFIELCGVKKEDVPLLKRVCNAYHKVGILTGIESLEELTHVK